jgi:8-oxo-(d)GTP phosphatase
VSGTIQAAGGVVVRRADGRAEVALIHRPRYDDWSLPKGKLHAGEAHLDAALREVEEETGLVCRAGPELASARYRTPDGASKVVRYWWMEPADRGDLAPTGEVDAAAWVPVREAATHVSHRSDREILEAAVARDAPAYLVRHAHAGSRSEWSGDDAARPLSRKGRRQALGLLRVFDGREVERVLSSPAVRCLQTVRPIAEARSLAVEERDELAEGRPLGPVLALLDELGTSPALLCAHGDLIPAAVNHLRHHGVRLAAEPRWKKGSTWMLVREAGVVVEASYVPPVEADGG